MNFHKLKDLKNSKQLYDLLLTFLRKGHIGIQRNSIECIFKFDKEEV
jgi:hypothetical protein